MIVVRCEPLGLWTHGGLPEPVRSRFDTPWPSTVDLLGREADRIKATGIVLAGGWAPDQIRRDGWPRAGARPTYPQVVVRLLGTPNGDLAYPSGTFDQWQDNVRAVALALEALRMVGRYGVARRGEQYTGFRALPAGEGTYRARRVAHGVRLIAEAGSFRAALMRHHPDHGGNPEDLADVQAANEQHGGAA